MDSNSDVAARTRRRVSIRLIPYLMLVYLLAYVDRANVSVAKLQMQGELHFDDLVIGFGAGIFFLGYLFLEIPGTLIVERWSARKWIARIMVTWGLIAAASGFLGTALFGSIPLKGQFYGMRLLLGAAEAGFFPGVIVYFSHWFRLVDRTRAKAVFMVTQPLSLLVAVPLSRWIMNSIHWGGLAGWRWIFILEGLPSVVLGIVTLFYLTDRPAEARWLKDDERAWLAGELAREEREKVAAGRVSISAALRNPQTILLVIVYFLIVASNQGFVFFLPSIVESLGGLPITWRTTAMSLPYLFGVAGILLFGFSAYRRQEQRWHVALPMLINGVALALVSFAGANHLVLTLLLLCLAGFTLQAYLPAFWTWPTAYLGQAAAAVAIGTINSVGNLGGFAGPYYFGYLRERTGSFQAGTAVLSACTIAAGVIALAVRVPKRATQAEEQP